MYVCMVISRTTGACTGASGYRRIQSVTFIHLTDPSVIYVSILLKLYIQVCSAGLSAALVHFYRLFKVANRLV